jgi:hypothetical protein
LRQKFAQAAVPSFGNFSYSREFGKNRPITAMQTLSTTIVILKNTKSRQNTVILALSHTISRIFTQTNARKIFQPAILK